MQELLSYSLQGFIYWGGGGGGRGKLSPQKNVFPEKSKKLFQILILFDDELRNQ